jgi:predicted ATPase
MLTTIVAAVAHQIAARGARDRTNTKRLAIVIDSLQWVDEQSLDIIRHLIRNVPKIFVVIATRNPGGSLVDSRKVRNDA